MDDRDNAVVTPKQRMALFIDAENASPSHLPNYLEHCRTLGKPTIARCYGSTSALKAWEAAIAKHHLIPIQTPPGASKANASDFALTIDAVSLLHRDLFDHAVIASSDADFTLLAVHIREHGKGIDGIGEAKAKASLKSAFDNYITVERQTAAKTMPAKAGAASSRQQAPASNATTSLLDAAKTVLAPGDKTTLGNMGKQLRAQMGDSYPNGKLSKHMAKYRDVFRVEGSMIERLK